MANKRFFILIFATLLLSAAHKASAFETSPISLNEKPVTCNAPAPTNFRITERSANFIVLAWDPAWQGATHTLAILESNGQGGWIGVDTLYQVTGDSYTAGGLTPGQIYRFVISTNCEDGTTSIIKAIIEGVGLITDLTIAGKTPRFPVNEVPCAEIPLNVVWKGFRVSKIGGEGLLSNEFEFVMNSPDWIMFRRVGLHKPIVAQNLVGNWPTCITPAVDIIGDKFRIARLMNGQGEYEVIGIVKYSVSSSHLYVCPIYDDTMFPWKNDYQLTGLTAGNTSPAQGCNGFDDGPSHEKSIALSYSTAESIEVRLRGYEHTGQRGTLWVFNTNGQLVQTLSFEFVSRDEVILANLSPLVPSLYFVAIEIDGQWETHKMCIIR